MAEEVKQGHLMDRVHAAGQSAALASYRTHTGGMLRRPRPEHVADAVSRSVLGAVVPILDEAWQARLDAKTCEHNIEAPLSSDELDEIKAMAYQSGLHHAWCIVENLEGKPGKKMIAELLRKELRRAEGAVEE